MDDEIIALRIPNELPKEVKEIVDKPFTPYTSTSGFIRAAIIILLRAERKISHLKGEEYTKRRSEVITLGGNGK